MPRPPSVLWTAPWRRAPLLLRRSPAVLLAVLAAGLILGAAAAATPLFLSSAANAALTRQIGERCPPTVGLQVRSIDHATFARGAFWDRSLADEPLDRIVAGLTPGPSGAPVPVVVVGRTLPDRFTFDLFLGVAGRSARREAVVTERVRAFPGERANPLVVVDRRALGDLQPAKETLLWARGSREQVLGALDQADVRVVGVVTEARDVLDVSSFLATAWTFGFLQALGILTGLITAGGLLLYLETRQRSRRAAYALSRRMGLSRAAHLGSLLAEVGGTLLGGLAIGVGLSLVATRLVYLRLDALPTVPPVPLLRVPVAAVAGTAAAVLAVTWLAAWMAQRSADRTNLAEVLRLAE